MINSENLKDFLDAKVKAYNCPSFIASDPISVPHSFNSKEDIEISGFLTAIISWGQRPTILKNAFQLMERMDNSPADFIRNHKKTDRRPFQDFVHRTFNGTDCCYFLKSLQEVYQNHGGLEGSILNSFQQEKDFGKAIAAWRSLFISFNPESRTLKHLSNPERNSSAKRICMYLRWMIRKDNSGVDFGLWKSIPASILHAPLDLHSGRVARSLGILTRKQDDWKAVCELTQNLRKLDKKDPVKYDFALFGLGINEKFK